MSEPKLLTVAGWPVLCWRFAGPVRGVSSGVRGGGIGPLRWVLNATVHRDYDRADPAEHVDELAAAAGCTGRGTGLLTAVDVRTAASVTDGPVTVWVTTGLGHPEYAAAPSTAAAAVRTVGTVNVVAVLAVPVTDAALVNAVTTVAEAKAQALADARVPGTGTCTDATVVCCPVTEGVQAHRYGGPRSFVGAPLARAVYGAVRRGAG